MSVAGVANHSDGRPVNRAVFHFSHIIMGFSVGYAVAANVWLFVYKFYGGHQIVLNNLWWTSSVMVLILMYTLREAMDAVRAAEYIEKADGQIKVVKKRRRHEVMMQLLKRFFMALILGILLLGLVVKIGSSYSAQLGLIGPLFAGKGLPPVGEEIALASVALFAGSLTLIFCEMILRASQKFGFPLQVLCLFLPSACGISFAMLTIAAVLK
jgi:hypothetical protein